jgi:hypothetical protein
MTCKVIKAFMVAALAWLAEVDGLRIKRVQMEPIQESAKMHGIKSAGNKNLDPLNWNLNDCKSYQALEKDDDKQLVMQYVSMINDVPAFLDKSLLDTRIELAESAMKMTFSPEQNGARWKAATELLQKKSAIVNALASRLTGVDDDTFIDIYSDFSEINGKRTNCVFHNYGTDCLFSDDPKTLEKFLKKVAKAAPEVSQQPLVVDEKRETICGLPADESDDVRAVLEKVGEDLDEIEDRLNNLKYIERSFQDKSGNWILKVQEIPYTDQTRKTRCLIHELSKLQRELEPAPSDKAAEHRKMWNKQQRQAKLRVKMNHEIQEHKRSFNVLGTNQSKQPPKGGPHGMDFRGSYPKNLASQIKSVGFRDDVHNKSERKGPNQTWFSHR